jgi:hypothetical protein
MMLEACLEDLLIRGLDDWIQAAEVASVSRTTGGAESEETSRELSLRLIQKLLEGGLAEAGMVDEQEGFVPWVIPVEDAMQRIESKWFATSMGPGLGEVCWLNLTEQGQIQARSLWARKAGRDS